MRVLLLLRTGRGDGMEEAVLGKGFCFVVGRAAREGLVVELVNQTPLAARVETAELAPDQPRIGLLSAKATFRFDLDGNVELETQRPLPLLLADEPTPLGILPSDFEPRRSA